MAEYWPDESRSITLIESGMALEFRGRLALHLIEKEEDDGTNDP